MTLLDPVSTAEHRVASTFEGFFFAAEDSQGPFVFLQHRERSEAEGTSWVANRCLDPSQFGPTGSGGTTCS